MNVRKFRALAIAAAAMLAAAAHAEVKIGFLGTFSGPAAALGQDQYDGFMLALEQKGGKLGGTPVKIVKEDDQLKPDLGVQLVRKLIESDKVDLVTGVTFSNVMMAVSKPLAAAMPELASGEPSSVTEVYFGSSPPRLTERASAST